jgi:hypothetical protein
LEPFARFSSRLKMAELPQILAGASRLGFCTTQRVPDQAQAVAQK